MKRRRLLILTAALLVALLTLGFMAWASEDQDSGYWPGSQGHHVGKFILNRMLAMIELREELNITPEQKEKFKQLLAQNRDRIKPVLTSMIEKKQTLHQAVIAETVDEPAIRRSAEELGLALAEAAVLASELVQEARLILTPEQVNTLMKFHDSRHEGFHGFIHNHLGLTVD